jgi:Immunity protein 22
MRWAAARGVSMWVNQKRKEIVESMSQAKHEDFRVGKFVSLWLGNLGSEEEIDDYLSLGEQFENDFGFEIYPPDAPEYDVSEEGPKPIHDLLEGFSNWETFIEAATTEANAKGWTEATTALVFYNFKYDPKFVSPTSSGLLTFIGVIPYGGFS